ncbi:SGNH/GDSL hydrolase family protein [Nocardioides nitrophenolicus]|uniref:SGNH/GDSL hydrolase family protein n=1 Tax=Nocardioides nitrophenolicus TaxID=60489 RepID=UPI00195D6C65|nr:SGNH/GDSL hydrolase family protein [Nocardioides nitrophenolicus]MBM7516536.1 lysophospholipase L1-like esterase [Nocardioides nitrophenolicus]
MRRPTALLLAAALAVPLSACETSSSGSERREYAALGDSYAAAPGVGSADSPAACRRSKDNYPHLLAHDLDLKLTDVSCSGASTEAVLGEYDALGTTLAPQIEAVGEDTDLVTIGLGFNDFGLTIRVFVKCVQLGMADPTGTPCTDADAAAGANSTRAALAQMTPRLTAVVEAVAKRAPNAQVVLVGYPTIFPEQETCANLGIARGDLPLVRGIVASLNASAKAAAEAGGATYVDTVDATRGHDICAEDPWIAGIKPTAGKQALYWHPYAEEQRVVADLVAEVVD